DETAPGAVSGHTSLLLVPPCPRASAWQEKSYRRCRARALHCAVKARATVATNQDDKNGISRREFATRVGAAAAGIAVGSEFFSSKAEAAPAVGRAARRILGANDRVVTASIGIRGQGNSLKRGFAKLKNVEIKTLCDIDANLAPERINDAKLAD